MYMSKETLKKEYWVKRMHWRVISCMLLNILSRKSLETDKKLETDKNYKDD